MTLIEPLISVTLLAYLLYVYMAIVFIGNRPVLMPKPIYRFFCEFGKRTQLCDDREKFNYLFKFQYVDHFYRSWRDDVLKRGWITDSEILAFGSKTINEMADEIKRRNSVGKM